MTTNELLDKSTKPSASYIPYGNNEMLDRLCEDEDKNVRKQVAKQKYGLDKLVNDRDWEVRAEVARQEYGLNVLVNDKDEEVRIEVAKHTTAIINNTYIPHTGEVRIQQSREGFFR